MTVSSTLSTLLGALQTLAYILVFLGAAAVAYLVLQQPRVKQWLADAGVLVRVALFIALTGLLIVPINTLVGNLFSLPNGLVNHYSNILFSVIQCLGGLLMLAALAVGGWLLAQRWQGKP